MDTVTWSASKREYTVGRTGSSTPYRKFLEFTATGEENQKVSIRGITAGWSNQWLNRNNLVVLYLMIVERRNHCLAAFNAVTLARKWLNLQVVLAWVFLRFFNKRLQCFNIVFTRWIFSLMHVFRLEDLASISLSCHDQNVFLRNIQHFCEILYNLSVIHTSWDIAKFLQVLHFFRDFIF